MKIAIYKDQDKTQGLRQDTRTSTRHKDKTMTRTRHNDQDKTQGLGQDKDQDKTQGLGQDTRTMTRQDLTLGQDLRT